MNSSRLMRSIALYCLSFLSASCFLAEAAHCQIISVGDETSAPIQGAGHDLIKLLSETVNPANGSVSLRINLPTPKGRGITLPFSLNYDSNGQWHIYNLNQWSSNQGALAQGGWSYSIPSLTNTNPTVTYGTGSGTTLQEWNCSYVSSYVFQDPLGGRHNLYLGVAGYSQALFGNPPTVLCGNPFLSGGDQKFKATLNASPELFTYNSPVTVSDASGTVYNFGLSNWYTVGPNPPGYSHASLPSSIEDRNGNVIQISAGATQGQFTVTDSVGRAAISSTGMGGSNTISVSGGGNYTVNWGPASNASYQVPSVQVGGPPLSGGCYPFPATVSGQQTVVTSLTLPNFQTYQFKYNNSYGLLSEIDYPDGAKITYTWMMSTQYSEPLVYNSIGEDNNGAWSSSALNGCQYEYSTPVLATRTVNFGNGTALTQTFSPYTTSWNSTPTWNTKTTTVKTTDPLFGTSQTIYTYSPSSVALNDLYGYGWQDSIPLESQIKYSDWGNTANVLRTVTKTWTDPFDLATETVVEGGKTSETAYTYTSGTLPQPLTKKEYDFGLTLLRETDWSYPSSPTATPVGGIIANMPLSIVVKDGNNNPYAETDYTYDVYASGISPVSATQHDDTNFPASYTGRGNITTKTRKCVGTSSCTASSTTYGYDETGQVVSVTDACGNPNNICADMGTTQQSHTTTYVYTDSYTILSGTTNQNYSPSGNTNTYLTSILDPLGHTKNFKYDYNNGQLTASQDQNDINANRTGTTYVYNDPFSRPKLVNYPDGGQTSLLYVDSSTPSVTTTKLVISGTNIVNTITADGLGHPVLTTLSSDPDGPTNTPIAYDGEGQIYQEWNPTRCVTPKTNCGTENTWGFTTYTYDALGRAKTVTRPDGSVVTTAYDQPNSKSSGLCTTDTDEANNARQSCVDGLGRMTGVWEDPGSSPHLNYETDYSYDPLNNLLSVTQNGSSSASARTRSFSYDSLSRLTSATNSESGVTTYTYDVNGNVATRLAPQANQNGNAQTTTTYTYDVLNRLLQVSHANPSNAKASYSYDGTAIQACPGVSVPTISSPTNLIGRRSGMCSQQSASSFSYDPMGRVALEARTNALNSPVTYTTGYNYYLDGSLKTLTYPSGDSVAYSVGGAGRTTQVSDASNNYVGSSGNFAAYTPNGALANMTNGYTSSFPGILTANFYNARLQPALLSSSSHWVATLISSSSYTTCTGACPAVYNVTSNSGISVGDAIAVRGNSNEFFNGTLTVQSLNAGQVVACCVNSPANESGQGGTLTDDTPGRFIALCYDFHLGGGTNVPGCSFSSSPLDNGNVSQVVDNIDSTRSAKFTYDVLNRITQANTVNTTSANCWGEAYTIDAWSNLTNINAAPGIGGNCTHENLSAAPANTANQLNGTWYDAAGNLLLDSSCPGNNCTPAYYYDAENRLYNPAATYTYWYDADGVRIRKAASATLGTMYWPSPEGKFLMETDGSGTINEEYIYFNGRRIARVDRPSGTVHYYFSDHLGSTAVITDSTGSVVQEHCYYYPYGGTVSCSGSDANHYKFTGKERDSETNLDAFGARYYGSSLGRFMTPDWADKPIDVPYADFGNPQSLNLYSYVKNNPTTTGDPDGHCGGYNPATGQMYCPPSFIRWPCWCQNPQNAAAQNTSAAAVAAGPTTKVVIKIGEIIVKVEGAADTAAGSILGAIGIVLLTPEKLGGGKGDVPTKDDKLCCDENGHDIEPEPPEPAAASGGKGVRDGPKDRSLEGNIDQLDGVEQLQEDKTKQGGYRISTEKSKQNLKKSLKDIKSLEDVENQ